LKRKPGPQLAFDFGDVARPLALPAPAIAPAAPPVLDSGPDAEAREKTRNPRPRRPRPDPTVAIPDLFAVGPPLEVEAKRTETEPLAPVTVEHPPWPELDEPSMEECPLPDELFEGTPDDLDAPFEDLDESFLVEPSSPAPAFARAFLDLEAPVVVADEPVVDELPSPVPKRDLPTPTGMAFVVPTERHVERFAVAGYTALTFPSLEERLLARLSNLSMATHADERATLAAVLEAHGGALEISGMEVASPRFYGCFLDALDDVARDVGTFERARGEAPDVAKKRIAFVSSLSRKLDQALADLGLVARRQLALHLAERVAESTPEEVAIALGAMLVETRLVVDLAPRRLVLLRALETKLAAVGGRASVCLPMFDRPFDSERIPDPLEVVSTWALRWLEDAPKTVLLGARLGTLDVSPSGDGAQDVDLHGIEIRLAASSSAEAHAVVDAVATALAAGAHVDAVAVGYGRRDDAFLLELGRAFEAAGIVAHGLTHETSMLPAFLFDALATLDRNDARALSRLFASPYVDLGLRTSEARKRLPTLARKLAQVPNVVRESARQATHVAVARAARPGARSDERARDTELVDRAFAAFEAFPEEGTVAELARATLAFFSALGVDVRVARSDVRLFATDDLDAFAKLEASALARDARAWAAFELALGEIVTASARASRDGVRTTRGRFFEEIGAVYTPSTPLPGASRSFAVRVAKLADLADEELDLLVVPTATSTGLGAPPPSSPLVSAEVLRALGHEPHVEAAKVLAGLALASSRAARVVLTACESDDEGASSVSHAVSYLAKRGAVVLSFGRAAWMERPLSHLDVNVARLLAGGLPEGDELRARVAIEGAREGFFLSERRPLSAMVGVMSSEAHLRVLEEETGRGKPLAATGLERLAECPFRGFSHVVLGAREPQEESELPSARDEGTRLHGALAAALTAVRDKLRARPRDSEAIQREGERGAMAYLADIATRGPLEPVLDARVMHVVRAVLLDSIRDETWEFEAAERAFGESEPSSWPPLVLGDDELRLRGRIDRVDLGRLRASARVVDYKRGSLTETVKKIGKTALQVPLYAMATQGPTGVSEVKGIYFSLRDDELARPNEKSRGEEAVSEAIESGELVETSLGAVRRVRLGDLAPRPDNEMRCRTCGLAGGCRRPRFAMPAEEDEAGGTA
jgi:RecB family exonuclease